MTLDNISKKITITAGIIGGLAVILGAFAAHGLQSILITSQIESFQTGVRYQFYHTFLLLFISISGFFSSRQKKVLWILLLVGIVLFSGSIYLLNIDEYFFGTNMKPIAVLTPIGGAVLIAAWTYMTISAYKNH